MAEADKLMSKAESKCVPFRRNVFQKKTSSKSHLWRHLCCALNTYTLLKTYDMELTGAGGVWFVLLLY